MADLATLKEQAGKRAYTDAKVGELDVTLRTMTAAEHCKVQAATAGFAKAKSNEAKGTALADAGALYIVHTVCELGSQSPMWAEADAEWIKTLPAPVFDGLAEAAMQHNGVGKADVEGLAKNSSETSGEDSPSA